MRAVTRNQVGREETTMSEKDERSRLWSVHLLVCKAILPSPKKFSSHLSWLAGDA